MASPSMRAGPSSSKSEKDVFLDEVYVPVRDVQHSSSIYSGIAGIGSASTSALQSVLAPAFRPLKTVANHIDAWKASLDLPYPGQPDKLGIEAKNVHLTNYMFDGARADLSKGFSMSPAFQVTHSFTLGQSVQGPMGGPSVAGGPGTYNFGAVYATNAVFMQGGVDHEGGLNGRMNLSWSAHDTSKAQINLQGGSGGGGMLQLEQERAGRDYCLNVKAYNPGVVDGTGIYTATYLQSLTKRLAVGAEALMRRQKEMSDTNYSFMGKYVGGLSRDWIATAQVMPYQGVLTGTYWQRLSDKVEAAAEVTLGISPAPAQRTAVATLAAKYDFRLAALRAQVDNNGKVSAHLEQRFTPAFSFLVTGEIDHWNNTSKWGIGLQLESSALDEEQAQAQANAAPLSPPV